EPRRLVARVTTEPRVEAEVAEALAVVDDGDVPLVVLGHAVRADEEVAPRATSFENREGEPVGCVLCWPLPRLAVVGRIDEAGELLAERRRLEELRDLRLRVGGRAQGGACALTEERDREACRAALSPRRDVWILGVRVVRRETDCDRDREDWEEVEGA